MSDETETKPKEEPQPDPTVAKLEKRNAALISQINEFKSKFAEIEATQADEAKKREQEAAAARGDFEKALELERQQAAELKARLEAQEKAHADALLKSQLERELVAKGATDEYFIDGVVSRYMQQDERPEVDAYLAEVADKSANYFKAAPPPNTGDATRVDTSKGQDEWAARKAALKQPAKFGKQPPAELQAITEAHEKVREYFLEHGVMPPGWSEGE